MITLFQPSRLPLGCLLAALLVLLAGHACAAWQTFVGETELEFREEGRVGVRWRSTDPLPPGRLIYGVSLPDDPYREPRFRFISREDGDSLRTLHEAELRLHAVQHKSADAAGQRAAGGGEVELRLELYRPRGRYLLVRHARFAYLREGDEFRRFPCLVSGPWLDRVGPGEAWLSWELDLAAEVLLDFGPADSVPPEPAVADDAPPDARGWRRLRFPAARSGSVRLDQLSAETRYAYHVRLIDAEGCSLPTRRWEFSTPPAPGRCREGRPIRIAFMSDSRGGAAGVEENVEGTNRRMIQRLMIQAERAGADLILFGGDLIDGYTTDPEHYRAQLAAWKQAAECVGPRLPIYEGMGNHEMLADDFSAEDAHLTTRYRDRAGPESSESLFAEAFVNPENGPPPPGPASPPFRENVYSFDVGPVHVVALNNTYDVASHPAELGGYREGWFPDEELAWLDADLSRARARGQEQILVFAHEPAFPCGGHAGDAMYWGGTKPEVLAMRDRFWEILMRHGVRAAMFGDEHNYSRLRLDERLGEFYRTPVWQIVSGGVGAPFYAADPDLPWSHLVQAFSAIQHFCLLELGPEGVCLTVIDSTGRILDSSDLD